MTKSAPPERLCFLPLPELAELAAEIRRVSRFSAESADHVTAAAVVMATPKADN